MESDEPRSQPDQSGWAPRATSALLVLTAILIVVLTVLRAGVFWYNEAYLDDTSGTWTALAKDLADGVFYRPLSGPDGFGGSRYFPLHFVLNAVLMKTIGDPIRSGQVLAAVAMALLVTGTYVLMVRVGTTRLVAATCAIFVLAVHPAQEALLAIKGDGLAAAFNVWGLAISVGATAGAGLIVAALFFTLAFATKLTTVSGLAAAVLWLAVTRGWRSAARLLVWSAAGMAAVLLVMYIGSHGVVLEIMRAGASGGASVRDILGAPLTLARQTRRVPETLAFVQLGCAALLVFLLRPRALRHPGVPFFVCVLGVTIAIFGSPGTDTNHLLDLHVASVVLVASLLVPGVPGVPGGPGGLPSRVFGEAALIVAALAASLSLMSGLVNAKSEQRRGRFVEALALIPDTSRPILAQNAMVAVAAGQRAYLLDSFMIRLNVESDPAFGEPLWSALRQQRFGAVVLERNPDSARDLYKVVLGERFIEEVERNYVVAGNVGLRTVFLPRPR